MWITWWWKSCIDSVGCLLLRGFVVFELPQLYLTFSTLKPLFSLSSLSVSPFPSPLSHSLSAPLRKTFLTALKSQQTKPWTTGIHSHQQITDSSVASFPEICNTLHMGTKCVPDARGSCVVQALLSAPRVLCYVIKNDALSYPPPNMGDIFITYCLCRHIYLLIFQLRCGETDSSIVLIRYCLRKWKSVPKGAVEIVRSWFVCIINRVHDAWWSSAVICWSDLWPLEDQMDKPGQPQQLNAK